MAFRRDITTRHTLSSLSTALLDSNNKSDYRRAMQFDLLDETHNQVLSSNTYEEFARRLAASDCKRCPLGKGRNNIVIGRGNPKAPIMIISERPGENEDREGVAFVGRAGELLDKIFAAIGLNTNKDTLICNVVKCMPPDVDRAPNTAEASACLPYLEKQIQLVSPKIIILLGAVALKYLSEEHKDDNMEDVTGQFLKIPEYSGIQFMTLYHPAFLLRDPTKKKPMWEHVKRLKEYIKDNCLMQNLR
jgi:DNA polymerase